LRVCYAVAIELVAALKLLNARELSKNFRRCLHRPGVERQIARRGKEKARPGGTGRAI
jgi:hypothetical protein